MRECLLCALLLSVALCGRFSQPTRIIVFQDLPACFSRRVTGRSLVARYVRKTIFCDSLRSCEEACSQEQEFTCEGFNFRFDRVGYESKCELTSVPASLLDFSSDFNSDRDVDFFSKDKGAPRSCFRPYSMYRPWNQYGQGDPWERRPHQYPPDYPPYEYTNQVAPNQYWGDKRYDPPPPQNHQPWGHPDECFVRTKTGFRLDRSVIVVSLTTPSLYDCEYECVNERKLSCNVFSFRYSMNPSVPGDNCHLGEKSYRSLDAYTDIIPDRDYDIYERNPYGREGCQPKKHWGSDCFERVRSGLKLDESMTKFALKASSLSECESACIHIPYFTCRAFSFRYGPPVIGQEGDNCLLTDWTIAEMDPRKHFIAEQGCELYNRGSYGHGCELNRYPDTSYPPQSGVPYGRPLIHKPSSAYNPQSYNHYYGHHHGNDIYSTYLPPDKHSGGYVPPDKLPDGYIQPDKAHGAYFPPDKPIHSSYSPTNKPHGNYIPPPKPPGDYLPVDKTPDTYHPTHGPYYPIDRHHSDYFPADRLSGGYFSDDKPPSSFFPPNRPSGGYPPTGRPDNSYFPHEKPMYHHRNHDRYIPATGYSGSDYRTRPTDQLCYIRYSTPARLLPSAIRTSLRVLSEQECKAECTRIRDKTMFRCATISYSGNHCELSDIEQRDLRPGYDYLPDKEDFWMFTWDFGTPRCHSSTLPGKTPQHDDFHRHSYDGRGVESIWSRFTVNGQPCRAGTYCRQNQDLGIWTCPVDNGDWDYCCRSGHHCGYTDGFPYPWCYVGSAAKDQWRPCSDSYYPYIHSGRKLHWPVAYLHTEGPPNVTITHQPSIVDTFLNALLKDVQKNGLLSKDGLKNMTIVDQVDLKLEPRKDDNTPSGTAMNKLWTWGQSKYNTSSPTKPTTSASKETSDSKNTTDSS